ncbi:MAG: RNA polymerase sigma factor [Oscillospiraceae bacterium]
MTGKALHTDDDIDDVLNKYSDMVYKIALSQTKNPANAEDIFQEVFLRYVQAGTPFESEEHRKAWLIRVSLNCCKKLWNSAWFRHTVPLDESLAFSSKEKSDIFYAVSELPQKYRIVIHLYYYEDLSVKEIGKILHRKEATITSQLSRARSLLREILKGEYGYGETAL